jgi:hypothetical protein
LLEQLAVDRDLLGARGGHPAVEDNERDAGRAQLQALGPVGAHAVRVLVAREDLADSLKGHLATDRRQN